MPLKLAGLRQSSDDLVKGFGGVVFGVVDPDKLTTDAGLVEVVPLAADENDGLVQSLGVILKMVKDPVKDGGDLKGSGRVSCWCLVAVCGGDRS